VPAPVHDQRVAAHAPHGGHAALHPGPDPVHASPRQVAQRARIAAAFGPAAQRQAEPQRPTAVARGVAAPQAGPAAGGGHGVVQRLPVTVAGKRYDEQEIARLRGAMSAIPKLDRLFDPADGKIWQLVNPLAFYKFLAALQAEGWTGELETVSHEQMVYRKAATEARPAGSVVVEGVVYRSAPEILEAPVFASYAPIKDVFADPRFLRIALDEVNKWAFDSWELLVQALDSWGGQAPYSPLLHQHREPTRPDSVLSKWNPDAITQDNALEHEATFNNVWQVCGQTATFMISRLHDLMGNVTLAYKKELHAANANELAAMLQADVEGVTLFNIGNRLVHEFTIEKRPSDQRSVLHQGYLSAYNSLWWAGLREDLISLVQGPKDAISRMRDVYGKGQTIAIGPLVEQLIRFMTAERIDAPQAQEAWKLLPFNPMVAPNSVEPPSLIVSVWQVQSPDTVLRSLEETLGSRQEWVTTAVQHEVLSVYQKILGAKGAL
jgi:hypothetical protein